MFVQDVPYGMKGYVLWKSRRVNDLLMSVTYTKTRCQRKLTLSNDQSNTCVAGTTRSVNARCSDVITVPLFFSPPRPPLPRAIIPDARPLGTSENQDTRDGKTKYI